MDDEKMFSLMEKMYSEFSKKFEQVDSNIADIKKSVAKIEIEHGQKLDALFDGYKQNSERLDRIEKKVDTLTSRVNKNEIEIRVIKGGKTDAK